MDISQECTNLNGYYATTRDSEDEEKSDQLIGKTALVGFAILPGGGIKAQWGDYYW